MVEHLRAQSPGLNTREWNSAVQSCGYSVTRSPNTCYVISTEAGRNRQYCAFSRAWEAGREKQGHLLALTHSSWSMDCSTARLPRLLHFFLSWSESPKESWSGWLRRGEPKRPTDGEDGNTDYLLTIFLSATALCKFCKKRSSVDLPWLLESDCQHLLWGMQ